MIYSEKNELLVWIYVALLGRLRQAVFGGKRDSIAKTLLFRRLQSSGTTFTKPNTALPDLPRSCVVAAGISLFSVSRLYCFTACL